MVAALVPAALSATFGEGNDSGSLQLIRTPGRWRFYVDNRREYWQLRTHCAPRMFLDPALSSDRLPRSFRLSLSAFLNRACSRRRRADAGRGDSLGCLAPADCASIGSPLLTSGTATDGCPRSCSGWRMPPTTCFAKILGTHRSTSNAWAGCGRCVSGRATGH